MKWTETYESHSVAMREISEKVRETPDVVVVGVWFFYSAQHGAVVVTYSQEVPE